MSLLPPDAVEFIGFVAPRHTSEIHPAAGPAIDRDYLKLLAQAHEWGGFDRVLVAYDGLVEAMAALYADGHDLKDPLISPIYGSFDGFPPTYLVTGTRDMFLSDTARSHRKLRAAGVVADLNVYEGFSHAEYLMVPTAPESREVFTEMGSFLAQHLQP